MLTAVAILGEDERVSDYGATAAHNTTLVRKKTKQFDNFKWPNWKSNFITRFVFKFAPFQPKNVGKRKHLTYPKAVIFVLLSKFFEAFAANGIRSTYICCIRSAYLSYQNILIRQLLFNHFEKNFHFIIAILALYLRDSLNFTEESSMTFYHIFNFFSQFCPIFGAIVADSYLGNVKTIFYLFFLYACGWIGMVILTFPLESIPVG